MTQFVISFNQSDDAPKALDSCVSIRVHARTLGHVTVSVTYKYADITLVASVTIASYSPLKVS